MRFRRNRISWITTAFAILIPLYLILFMQRGVTKAQEGDPTATETPTYLETLTGTPSDAATTTETATNTLTLVSTSTGTDIFTATLTQSRTPTPTLTRTLTTTPVTPTFTRTPVTLSRTNTITPTPRTPTRTPTETTYLTSTDTETPATTPIPPTVGSCASIPFPTEIPQPGGRGLFPYGIHVDYFNDTAPSDYTLDSPINWMTLTSPSNYSGDIPTIDFAWNGASPAPGMYGVFWSACYQGYLQVPENGTYTFYLDSLDDGGMLFVGDLEIPIISSWLVQGPHFYQAEITLSQGITPIRLVYAQGPGTQSSVTLAWSSSGFSKETIGPAGINPATPTPTKTPRTPTYTKTPTPSPTPTITETATPTPTDTPTQTLTATEQTLTLSPTSWILPTDTETVTETPTKTNTVTITKTFQITANPNAVYVNVLNASYQPLSGIYVYAFDGDTYTGHYGVTDIWGNVIFILADGSYRFMVEKQGAQFWSGESNHCTVPYACRQVNIVTKDAVAVTVLNGDGNPEAGLTVQAYNGTTFTGYASTTNAQGQATIWLPAGNYRFVAHKNGVAFWSGAENHCKVSGCTSSGITVFSPVVVVAVRDASGWPLAGIKVYAFDGTTYTGRSGITDADGQAVINLPNGSYRFRVDKPGYQFWSGPSNHCTVPNCAFVLVRTRDAVVVTVLDTLGNPEAGLNVLAYDGATFTGLGAVTNAQGQATLWLPAGNYRFRATKNGAAFWSGTENHCTVSGCASAEIITTIPVVVTALSAGGSPEAGLKVWAMNGSTYTGYMGITNAEGQVSLTLPAGNYRFRVDKPGNQFWSGPSNHCTVPGCTNVTVTTKDAVLVTVLDTGGNPEIGMGVQAYNGTAYTGYGGVTNAQGQATLWLSAGSYRFRATKNGTVFWSGTENHCTISGCTSAGITTTVPVVVSVVNPGGQPEVGLKVWAMNGSTYAGYMGTTNASGQVTLTLPQGDYRFRVDKPGNQFWSGSANHCTVPGCTAVTVTTKDAVVVMVLDAVGNPEVGLNILAYNGTTYTGYGGVTDSQGRATIWLPAGNYRFRAMKDGTSYWSGAENHCTIPGCASAGITTGSGGLFAMRAEDSVHQPGQNKLVEMFFSPRLWIIPKTLIGTSPYGSHTEA